MDLGLGHLAGSLEQILNASYDEIFISDGDGVTRWVNQACAQLYGVRPEDLIGRTANDMEASGLFSPSATLKVLREGKAATVMHTTPTGRHVVATANPVRNDRGDIIAVITNSRDMTDVFRLQEQVDEFAELIRRWGEELAEHRAQVLDTSEPLIGNSKDMEHLKALIRRVARVDSTVLIHGESGVGKNVVATQLHRLSPRADGPFIHVNCGAIPESLLESELFGYEGGAFTGALKHGKAGLFALADGGTLFLDEISEFPLHLQVKLLTVIQDRQFMPVGGTKPVSFNARLVCATNQDLVNMVDAGRFRRDLFYRINVIPVTIPPLRQRAEDIPLLVQHALNRHATRLGAARHCSPEVMESLLSYPWPGNIRELENTIERMCVLSEGGQLDIDLLPREIRHWQEPGATPVGFVWRGQPLHDALKQVEGQILAVAAERFTSTYQIGKALGISQASASRKLREHRLTPGDAD